MSLITVHAEQGYRTAIQIRHHTVIADELIQDGGTDIGPTPMEILLGTVGACVVVTTKAYARESLTKASPDIPSIEPTLTEVQ